MAFIPVWAFLNLCIFIPVRKNQVCQRSFKALFLCELSPVPEGNLRTERNPPNKMGLLYSSSNVPKTVLFLEFVVPSWNEMHSPLSQLGQHREVMSEGKYKSRLENYTYCEVSGINPGVTALEQTLRGDQGSLRSEEAQEIIHKSLNNCHRLGKNRLNRKQVTRSKVKGHWVELEARPGSTAECWYCRQMPARARASSRKTKSPEEKPSKDMRSSHTNWPCNCEFAETELALDKIRLFSFPPGKVLTLYANKSSRKLILFFQWGKTAMPADPEQTGTSHL